MFLWEDYQYFFIVTLYKMDKPNFIHVYYLIIKIKMLIL